jgi:hypothetical protein
MKAATWESCSGVSLNSELANLREVETNLAECFRTDPRRCNIVVALSFLQMAIAALAEEVEAARSATA